VLLPDDENDPTGRGIRFSKKAGKVFEEFFQNKISC